jgi:SAM-dependent methyltransferase
VTEPFDPPPPDAEPAPGVPPRRSGDPVPLDLPEPGQPFRATSIAHARLRILGPTSAADLDALLDTAETAGMLRPGARVLDIGCGKGDLLVRVARRGATGVGIDLNRSFLAEARRLAADAGVDDRVRFELADGGGLETDGEYDLVACVGATDAVGGPAVAPARLAVLARPGGAVLIGEGFWHVTPRVEQAATFGMEPDEMVDLDATLERMRAPGLDLLATRVAGTADWDAYEAEYAGALERWAATRPDDPQRDALEEQAAEFRSTWGAWRREAMGFVVALLRR